MLLVYGNNLFICFSSTRINRARDADVHGSLLSRFTAVHWSLYHVLLGHFITYCCCSLVPLSLSRTAAVHRSVYHVMLFIGHLITAAVRRAVIRLALSYWLLLLICHFITYCNCYTWCCSLITLIHAAAVHGQFITLLYRVHVSPTRTVAVQL